jgi:hypothetical protein
MHSQPRRPARLRVLFCILPLMAMGAGAGACDKSSGDTNADSGVDAGPDATLQDAAVPDSGPDGATGDSCAERLVLDTVFELDPDGPDTQIHVNAAFDGESLWVVWNRPDGNNYFDVWAQRLGCDGAALVAPFLVNTTDHNEIDPSVAVGDGNVYVVWQADNNTGVNNMDILMRTYTVDGAPIMTADAIVETTYDGTPVEGNVMAPGVTALPGGQFAVSGVRGLDVAPAWQVFAQRLHADGSLVAEALSPIIEPAATHMYPAIEARPDGTLHLAYTRAEGIYERIYHTAYAADATAPDPNPPVEGIVGAEGTGVALASSPSGDIVYLAFGDGNNIALTTTDATDGPTPVYIGGSGTAHSPVLATRDGGGALVYYVNVGGLNNELRAVAFSYDGTTLSFSTVVVLIPDTVPPYQASITHITDDIYFVAWSGGPNPDYRISGQFVELAAP